jgi:hypothetical protein
MNIADDEYSLIASRHRHGAAWDHLPLTEQPSNLRASWPVWLALLAYGAVVVLVAAWVWP